MYVGGWLVLSIYIYIYTHENKVRIACATNFIKYNMLKEMYIT